MQTQHGKPNKGFNIRQPFIKLAPSFYQDGSGYPNNVGAGGMSRPNMQQYQVNNLTPHQHQAAAAALHQQQQQQLRSQQQGGGPPQQQQQQPSQQQQPHHVNASSAMVSQQQQQQHQMMLALQQQQQQQHQQQQQQSSGNHQQQIALAVSSSSTSTVSSTAGNQGSAVAVASTGAGGHDQQNQLQQHVAGVMPAQMQQQVAVSGPNIQGQMFAGGHQVHQPNSQGQYYPGQPAQQRTMAAQGQVIPDMRQHSMPSGAIYYQSPPGAPPQYFLHQLPQHHQYQHNMAQQPPRAPVNPTYHHQTPQQHGVQPYMHYNQPPMFFPQQAQQNINKATPQPAPAKREKKLINIQDPITSKKISITDLVDDKSNKTPPPDRSQESSSASTTPAPGDYAPQNDKIYADFAAQSVAGNSSNGVASMKNSISEDMPVDAKQEEIISQERIAEPEIPQLMPHHHQQPPPPQMHQQPQHGAMSLPPVQQHTTIPQQELPPVSSVQSSAASMNMHQEQVVRPFSVPPPNFPQKVSPPNQQAMINHQGNFMNQQPPTMNHPNQVLQAKIIQQNINSQAQPMMSGPPPSIPYHSGPTQMVGQPPMMQQSQGVLPLHQVPSVQHGATIQQQQQQQQVPQMNQVYPCPPSDMQQLPRPQISITKALLSTPPPNMQQQQHATKPSEPVTGPVVSPQINSTAQQPPVQVESTPPLPAPAVPSSPTTLVSVALPAVHASQQKVQVPVQSRPVNSSVEVLESSVTAPADVDSSSPVTTVTPQPLASVEEVPQAEARGKPSRVTEESCAEVAKLTAPTEGTIKSSRAAIPEKEEGVSATDGSPAISKPEKSPAAEVAHEPQTSSLQINGTVEHEKEISSPALEPENSQINNVEEAKDSKHYDNGLETSISEQSDTTCNESTASPEESLPISVNEIVNESKEDAETSENVPSENVPSEESSRASSAPPTNKLKYIYTEQMWSPINPKGAKAYGREFLVGVRGDNLATQKPLDLPDLDIVKNEMVQARSFDRNSMSKLNMGGMSDFTPQYMRQGGHKGGNSYQGHRGSSNSMQGIRNMGGGPGKKAPKVIESKSTVKMSLKTTEKAWAPVSKGGTDLKKVDVVSRNARAIMNKICPENYERLKETFRALLIQNEDCMDALVTLIFEKATGELHFSGVYSQLCKFVVERNDKDNAEGISTSAKFRKVLLVKCQHEFEKKHKLVEQRENEARKSQAIVDQCTDEAEKAQLQTDHDAKFVDKDLAARLKLSSDIKKCGKNAAKAKRLQDELDALEDASRRKSVGLIKYVAELFNEGLLTHKIVMSLFITLLKDINKSEQAEILCKLFITIGHKVWAGAEEREKNQMREWVQRMLIQSKAVGTETRIKFFLQDAMDLFQNNWVAKHQSQKKVGPSTKREVLERMTNEQEQFERMAATSQPQHNNQRRGDDKMRGGRHDRGSMNREVVCENSDVWKKVINSSNGNKRQGFRSIGSRNSDNAVEQRLGPGANMSMWSQGASGGARDIQPREIAGRTNNRFNALQDDDSSDVRKDSHHRQFPGPIRNNPFKEHGSYGDNHNRGTDRSNSTGRRPNSGQGAQQSGDARNKSLSRDNMPQPSQASGFYQPKRPQQHSPRDEPPRSQEPAVSHEDRLSAIQEKTKCSIDEYCAVKDITEAIMDVKEKYGASDDVAYFIQMAITGVLERKPADREAVAVLIKEMLAKKVISLAHFKKSLCLLFAEVADLSIDIPQIAQYIAVVLGPSVLDGRLTLADWWSVTEAADYLRRNLIVALLQTMAKEKEAEEEVFNLWVSSGLKWDIIIQDILARTPVTEFLEEKKLKFLDTSSAEAAAQPSMVDDYIKQIQGKHADMRDRAAMKNLVKTLVKPSIKESKDTKAVVENDDYDSLCDRLEALKKVMEQDKVDGSEVELSILHGLQALAVEHGVPSGLLATLFEAATSTEVISQESLAHWESCADDQEAGLGVCVTSVQSFLRNLRNTNSSTDS